MYLDMENANPKLFNHYPNEDTTIANMHDKSAIMYPTTNMTTNSNTSTNTLPYSMTSFYPNGQQMTVVHDLDDEDEVKRPMNSFLLWAKIMRKKYASENPNMHNAEISKLLGKIWNSMTSKDKRPFVEQAEKLRVLHMKTYPNYRYAPKRKGREKNRCTRMISPEVAAAALHNPIFDVNNIISEQIHSQDLKSYGYLRKVCEKNMSKTKETDALNLGIYNQPSYSPNMSCSPTSSESGSYGGSMVGSPTGDVQLSIPITYSEPKSETMTLHYYPTITTTINSSTSAELCTNKQTNAFHRAADSNCRVSYQEFNSKNTWDIKSDEKPASCYYDGRTVNTGHESITKLTSYNTNDKDISIEQDLPDFLKVLMTPTNTGLEGQDQTSFWSDIGEIISSGTL